MFHLFEGQTAKTKNKPATTHYFVIAITPNGRTLSTSETFTQKPAPFKNVAALIKLSGGKGAYVQDNTLKDGPVVKWVDAKGKVTITDKKPRRFK